MLSLLECVPLTILSYYLLNELVFLLRDSSLGLPLPTMPHTTSSLSSSVLPSPKETLDQGLFIFITPVPSVTSVLMVLHQ